MSSVRELVRDSVTAAGKASAQAFAAGRTMQPVPKSPTQTTYRR
jgi:hypothetical protein